MADNTVDQYLTDWVFLFCDEIAQLSCEVELYIWVIDTDGAGERVVNVLTGKVDVLIGIAFIVKMADESFGLDVWVLLVVQLSLDR